MSSFPSAPSVRLRGVAACLLCAAAAAAGPVEDLAAWLAQPRAARPALESQAFASTPLTAAEAGQAADLLWADRLARAKAEWGAQWTAKRLTDTAGLAMPFDYRIYGPKPAKGYDLYISMHGGGGVAASVNDEQWRNQIVLYQPPGIYLAPRAPTDAWNMWHKDHIDTFFDRIIVLCAAFLEANPDRVYVMGYSAGGDGAYHMAPRLHDRWAAGAMMAGYPNRASPVNLRNIGFAIHVGANDAAYGRNTVAAEFARSIQRLQDGDPGFYRYQVQIHAGKGHWMDLEDKVALPWMAGFTRDPRPRKVVWLQDTTVGANSFPSGPMVIVPGRATQRQAYWVALAHRSGGPKQASLTAEIAGQEARVLASNVDSLVLLLDDRLLDLDRPVTATWLGQAVFQGTVTRTVAALGRSLEARSDRAYLFPARLTVRKPGTGTSLRPRAAGGTGRTGRGVAVRNVTPARPGGSHVEARDLRGARLPRPTFRP